MLAALLGLAGLGLLSSGAHAQQQTGQITGIVTDAQGGTPLAEVQVFLAGQNIGTISRANGRYLIPSVPAGTYELHAQRIGLRQKLEPNPRVPHYILTVHGLGYKFVG